MAKVSYEVLEHKSDTGFMVTAPSFQRLYVNAALALTDMRVSLDLIDTGLKKTVEVSADDKESLMVKWLNEILYLFDAERFLCGVVVITEFSLKKIKATLHGQTYIPTKHGHVSEIKAVTYHQLQIGELNKSENGPEFFARIFVDL